MMAKKNQKLEIKGGEVTVVQSNQQDYISITDIARYKNPDRTDVIIGNWLRNRNTIEFLGIWEQLNNSSFKPIEFDGFKKQAGLNSFTLTPKQWREQNPDDNGNIRDYANVSQLVCLTNLENLNAVFINEGMVQSERLPKLNQIALQYRETKGETA